MSDLRIPDHYKSDRTYAFEFAQNAVSQASEIVSTAFQKHQELRQRQATLQAQLEQAQYKSDLNRGRSLYKTLSNKWRLEQGTDVDYTEMVPEFEQYMRNNWVKAVSSLRSDRAVEQLQYEFEEYLSGELVEVQGDAQSKQASMLRGQYEFDKESIINNFKDERSVGDLYQLTRDMAEAGVISGKEAGVDFVEGVKGILEKEIYNAARNKGYEPVIQNITNNPPKITFGEDEITFSQDELEDIVQNLDSERKAKIDIEQRQAQKVSDQLYEQLSTAYFNDQLTLGSIREAVNKGLDTDKAKKLENWYYADYERRQRINERSLKEEDAALTDQLKQKAQWYENDIALRIGHDDPDTLDADLNGLVKSVYGAYMTDSQITSLRQKIDNMRDKMIPDRIMDAIDGLEIEGRQKMALESAIYEDVVKQRFPEEGKENYLSAEDYAKIYDSHVQPLLEDRLKKVKRSSFDIFNRGYQDNTGILQSAASAQDIEADESELTPEEREWDAIISRVKRGTEYSPEEIDSLKPEIKSTFEFGFKWHFKHAPPKGADVPGKRYDPPVEYVHGVVPIFQDASGEWWTIDIENNNEVWKRWDKETGRFKDDVTTDEITARARRYVGDYAKISFEYGENGEVWIIGANKGDTQWTRLEKVR